MQVPWCFVVLHLISATPLLTCRTLYLCPSIGAQEAVTTQTAQCLLHLVVCTAPPFSTFLNWILMLVTWLKGRVSFFQCLNFIHLAATLSPLIHILSTLALSCVLSGLSFNMHRLVWSACRFLWGCLPWSFLSSHSGSFWQLCGPSLVFVNALPSMSHIFCVNVTFVMF